jgi:hypothetical protein
MISVLILLTAMAAATVSFFHWQASHNKIVLDLFDRRLEFYEQLAKVISNFLASFNVTDDMLSSYERAMTRSRFLFGPDVAIFLKSRHKDLLSAWSAQQMGHKDLKAFDRLKNFFEEGDQIFFLACARARKSKLLNCLP